MSTVYTYACDYPDCSNKTQDFYLMHRVTVSVETPERKILCLDLCDKHHGMFRLTMSSFGMEL